MSGLEIAGVVLGGLPLLISAIEYSGKVKKYGKAYWRSRDTYAIEKAAVGHCQTIFQLHLQELLQPLLVVEVVDAVQYEELLSKPGGDEWKDASVEESLRGRLAGTYDQYLTTLRTLQIIIVKLSQKVKTQDPKFKQWLEGQLQEKTTAHKTLVERANDMCAKAALQPSILKQVASLSSREELLAEVDKYISKLQTHLASAERVATASKDPPAFSKVPVPKILHGFWSTASRIYRMMQRCFPCSCAASHCARLWLDQRSLLSRSLDLQLLFDKSAPQATSPWARHDVAINERRTAATCSCETQPGALRLAALGTVAPIKSPQIAIHSPQQAASHTPSQSIKESNLCVVLHNSCQSWQCFGSVRDDLDDCCYHVLSGQRDLVAESVSLSEVLDSQSKHVFPLVMRLRVAKLMAIAHLRYHQTHWLQYAWSLHNVYFPKLNTSDFDYEAPCTISNLATGPAQPPSATAVDFSELGIVLLELAYGCQIESHAMWHDPKHPGRDPSDPVMRKAVACKWAEGLALAVPGEGYAHAVEWCLYQAPRASGRSQWRHDFADNVVAPLQAYK